MKIKNNKVYFGKTSAQNLAQKFGTPLYVYEAETIKERYLELVENITYEKLKIHFACKANTNKEVLVLLKKLGSNIETVSRGEIELALKAGFMPNQIIYTSTSVSKEEMAFVIKNKIYASLDSLDQIELYGKLNPGSKIGLRLNLGIGSGHHAHAVTGGALSKFGIVPSNIPHALKIASKYKLTITSLHQHIGSNVLDAGILLKAFDALLDFAKSFPDLESLDFGGCLGVPYKNEKRLNVKFLGGEMTKRMNKFCREYGKDIIMVIEPGRFLVAESGFLLTQVMEIKINPGRTFVGIDTGLNHLIRPAMYGSHHEIIPASNVHGAQMKVDIVGNICESGDVLGRDRMIARLKKGDIVVILNTGAYGYVMASHYNTRSLPLEIFLK
jgi:diaminopimelate decarboxylase